MPCARSKIRSHPKGDRHFHFVHDICTTEVLAAQRFFRCANLSSAAQLSFSRGSQSATCNKAVVLFSGEGDYLRMIVNVFIGCDGDLTAQRAPALSLALSASLLMVSLA
jgi:hypothetical protein